MATTTPNPPIPASTANSSLFDDALDDAIQNAIVGIVGTLAPELVKPRWQQEPPNMLAPRSDWCSVGVVGSEMNITSFITQLISDTTSEVLYYEELTVLVSFYGANAGRNDARLRAGLAISQNTAMFRAAGCAVVRHSGPTKVPSLLKQQWQPRVDSTLILSRFSSHRFAVGRIKYAVLDIDSETQQRAFVSPLPT